MVAYMNNRLDGYTDTQRMYLLKSLISGFTGILMIAALTMEIVSNFEAYVILLKNYLSGVPLLLITVPAVRKCIKKYPRECYKLKGILSVLGIVLLIVTELMGLSKVWYLVDAGIMSFIGLLMMPHASYYKSHIIDKSKDYSEDMGYVDLICQVGYVVVGLSLVYLEIPTIALLLLIAPMEIVERTLENRCAKIVFND